MMTVEALADTEVVRLLVLSTGASVGLAAELIEDEEDIAEEKLAIFGP